MLGYIYVGYPFFVFLLSKFINNPVEKGRGGRNISIIIAAYNEDAYIADTIENKLMQDYSDGKVEIIVVSDASTDKTDEIVENYNNRGVRLLTQERRKGKTDALNMAVTHATGEILVFSDANSLYAPDALKYLVRNFQDPSVGYVTGKMVYVAQEASCVGDGCSAYMRYENFLRRHETRLGSIVGVDGGIDAMRKRLYRPMRPDQLPDFILPLGVVQQGYRVVYESKAILREQALSDSEDEYRMRVRVALRALWALEDKVHLLDVRKHNLFSVQLLSHKLLRYLGFVFVVGAYVSNALISINSLLWGVIFLCRNIFYAGALVAFWRRHHKSERSNILSLPYYFSLINLACGQAFFEYLLRKKKITWTPRKG